MQYSQRNLPANKVRKYTQSATIPEDYSGGDLPQSPPTELADSALQSWSPSGTLGLTLIRMATHGLRFVKQTSAAGGPIAQVLLGDWSICVACSMRSMQPASVCLPETCMSLNSAHANSQPETASSAGQKGFIAKPGTDAESLTIEVWGRSRLLKQLKVPKKLHGPVYNDGWFGSGASWSLDEHLLAYVAEVCSRMLKRRDEFSSCRKA